MTLLYGLMYWDVIAGAQALKSEARDGCPEMIICMSFHPLVIVTHL